MSKTSTMEGISKEMRKKLEYDDQVKLNYALKSMNPVWKAVPSRENVPLSHDQIKRATTAGGFTVTLFSEDMVCRRNCTEQRLSQYYVWHKVSRKRIESKTNSSGQVKLWFLRKDWNITSNATGELWLQMISELP